MDTLNANGNPFIRVNSRPFVVESFVGWMNAASHSALRQLR